MVNGLSDTLIKSQAISGTSDTYLSRKPLVSTSANVSGEPSPANFSEVSEVIKEGVDYIVSYRQDDMSKAAPSGIIKLGAGGLVQVIR